MTIGMILASSLRMIFRSVTLSTALPSIAISISSGGDCSCLSTSISSYACFEDIFLLAVNSKRRVKSSPCEEA
jgi:hypothetical protein